MNTKDYNNVQAGIYPPNIFTKIYTLSIKNRFKKFGANSFIQYPSTIRNPQAIEIKSGVYIREYSWLNVTENNNVNKPSLVIGNGVYIGRFSQINAYQNVIIEDRVLIADRVFISDFEHKFSNIEKPVMNQGFDSFFPVKLCYGSWIGIGAVIFPGITIGRNSVIGANAVVTKNVPDYSVAAGVPAKIIKILKNE